MKGSRVHLILAAAAALCLPLAAGATLIVPVSQTRSVSAFADGFPSNPSSSTLSASDFGPWGQSANANWTYFAYFFNSGVEQNSTIGDAHLTAHVTSSFGGFTEFGGGPGATESIFDVTFDLTALASYQLGNGSVPNQSGGYGSHGVTLRDENGQVIAQPSFGTYPLGLEPTDLLGFASISTGVLAPGRYRLTAVWNQNYIQEAGQANAAAVLLLTQIPEPGTALLLALGLGALAARRRRSES